MCCTRLSWNTGCKNDAKNRHLGTIVQLCRAESSQLRHVSIIKKILLSSNISSTFPQYGKLRSTSGWDRFGSLGHPSKFQRVSRLEFVTAATSLTRGQPNFARCMAVSWAGTLYMHFRGLLPPDSISPRAKFTLRPSLAFSYIGSVTARHSSSGISETLQRGISLSNGIMELSQRAPPIFGWVAITLDIGWHSGCLFCCACHNCPYLEAVNIVCEVDADRTGQVGKWVMTELDRYASERRQNWIIGQVGEWLMTGRDR